MDTKINNVSSFYLRTPDGTVYGPVDIVTLCIWATDARVIPGCQLSERQDVWFPVESVPELRLNWSVELTDGTIYGPLNLLAIRLLASEKSIPTGSTIKEKGTDRKAVLDDSMLPLLEEEFRQMLTGCGNLVNATVGALRGAYKTALNEVEECAVKIADFQAKQENADKDLAVSLRLNEALSHQLNEAQVAVQKNVAIIHELEKTIAQGKVQTETQAVEMGSKLAQAEKTLHEVRQQEKLLVAQLEQEREIARKNLIEERTVWTKESQSAIQKKEVLIQQLETAVAHGKNQVAAQTTEFQLKLALQEKTADELRLKVTSMSTSLQEAEQREKNLAAELIQEQARVILLKETQNILQTKEALIQQLEKDLAQGKMQAETKMAEMSAKVASLEKVYQESKSEAELLSVQLSQAQEHNQALLKDSARKEQEFSDRIKKVEAEIKDSTELMAETMREVGRRESQLQDLKKKMDQRERETSKPKSGAVVEVEAIDSEVLHTEPIGTMKAGDWIAPPPRTENSDQEPGAKASKPGILNSVEARLQMELRQWEVLKKEQKQQKKSTCKWF